MSTTTSSRRPPASRYGRPANRADVWRSEARTGTEFAQFLVNSPVLLRRLPRGNGTPVVVLPGLGAADSSTTALRTLLGSLRYRAHGWGLGRNTGFRHRRVEELVDRLRPLAEQSVDGQVALVGWSLGGVYAHAIARSAPELVRTVVSLGSPHGIGTAVPPSIPLTSVHSRTDAIVPWQMSMLRAGPRRENVEVRGSHLGLGHNTAAAIVIVDRLHQTAATWEPFTPPSWAGRWFPSPR